MLLVAVVVVGEGLLCGDGILCEDMIGIGAIAGGARGIL
jgi:hypothetical protein